MQNTDKYKCEWTPIEKQILREHFPNKDSAEVAKILGRTLESVRKQASLLGLKKTAEARSEIARARIPEGPRKAKDSTAQGHTTTDELKHLYLMRENQKALKGYLQAAVRRTEWGGIDKTIVIGRARAYLANPECFIR